MSDNYSKEDIEKLTEIIQKQYYEIVKKEAEIAFYENNIKKLEVEIPYLQEKNETLRKQNEADEKELEFLTKMLESLKQSYEVGINCCLQYSKYNNLFEKYSELQAKETEKIKDECDKMIAAMTEKLHSNELNKKLEQAKLNALKSDIQVRQLEVRNKKMRERIALKESIQKQMFYNYFIRMAENYVKNQEKMKPIDKTIIKQNETKVLEIQPKIPTRLTDRIENTGIKLEKHFPLLTELQHIIDDDSLEKIGQKQMQIISANAVAIPKFTFTSTPVVNKSILKASAKQKQENRQKICSLSADRQIIQRRLSGNEISTQQNLAQIDQAKSIPENIPRKTQITKAEQSFEKTVKKNVHFQLAEETPKELLMNQTTSSAASSGEVKAKEQVSGQLQFSPPQQVSHVFDSIVSANEFELSPPMTSIDGTNAEQTTSPFFSNLPSMNRDKTKRFFDEPLFFQTPFNPLCSKPAKIKKCENENVIDKGSGAATPACTDDSKKRLTAHVETATAEEEKPRFAPGQYFQFERMQNDSNIF